jgi:S-formylglutathione hydrolase FrmB
MALCQTSFVSQVLGLKTSMNVILPEVKREKLTQTGGMFPVLYLLHGLSDDHSTWLRRTSIERYAEIYNLAVVMPSVHRSFYADMRHGYRYWTFISEELPRIVQGLFPITQQPEHTYVAGLSMGGYGAFKLALHHPDRFAAAGSFSGVLDIATQATYKRYEHDYELIFGDVADVKGSENDLLTVLEQNVQAGNKLPRLYQCCGTEDYLYEDNLRFKAHCEQLGVPLTYDEGPGNHEWGYWDHHVQQFLAWALPKGM